MNYLIFCSLQTFLIHRQLMNIKVQRQNQRNITPNFIIMRRKGNLSGLGKHKDTIDDGSNEHHNVHTDRSSSRASKSSFELFEKRVLHLGKLRNNLKNRIQGQKASYIGRREEGRKMNSNQKQYSENAIKQKIKQNISIRKKTNNSGRIINQTLVGQKTSVPKRNQQSLEKEEQMARLRNQNLLQDLMKYQQVPNYMNKLKSKKHEIDQRKKAKKKMLNIVVQLKSQQHLNHYQIYGQLGKGAYGVVKMAVDKRTGEKVAVKVYEKCRLDEANKITNIQREINILSGLSHQTIAKLIQVIQNTNQIYLIMEYGGANSLYNYLLSKNEHRLNEDEALSIFFTIAEALQYLHHKNIVHRDIKAQNILLNRHKQLKLIDFGFSLKSETGKLIDTFCGTPTYMAPEIVSKIDHIPIYTDMWSLGILLYVMVQGNYPFRAKNQDQLFQKIRKGEFKYIYNDISVDCKRLIQSLLKVQQSQRITIDEVLTEEFKYKINKITKKQPAQI